MTSLNTTRSTGLSPISFFAFSNSNTCQLMASPSRSGSVARMSLSACFSAVWISLRCFFDPPETCHFISKSSSGSTDPSLLGRSHTWPKDASTLKSSPRYRLMVLALAGDSTMTSFMRFLSLWWSACDSTKIWFCQKNLDYFFSNQDF